MSKVKMGFIGGGNMGEAILAALFKKKVFAPTHVGLFEPDRKRALALKKKFKISLFDSNRDLAASSKIILLAVKPQHASQVLQDIQRILTPQHLFISIAAGLDLAFFQKQIPQVRLIRVMPNMGMMIGEGASAIYASPSATLQDKKLAQKIFSAGGVSVFVEDEKLLDAVTAVSGSGPAFVFLFVQALIQAGITQGLKEDIAKKLVLQTFMGAVKMIEASSEEILSLISKVASKGGTTEAGLKVLAENNFPHLIENTIAAATQRAKELRCIS